MNGSVVDSFFSSAVMFLTSVYSESDSAFLYTLYETASSVSFHCNKKFALSPSNVSSCINNPDGAIDTGVISSPLIYGLVPPTTRFNCPSSTTTVALTDAAACLVDTPPIATPSAVYDVLIVLVPDIRSHAVTFISYLPFGRSTANSPAPIQKSSVIALDVALPLLAL